MDGSVSDQLTLQGSYAVDILLFVVLFDMTRVMLVTQDIVADKTCAPEEAQMFESFPVPFETWQ